MVDWRLKDIDFHYTVFMYTNVLVVIFSTKYKLPDENLHVPNI